MFSSKIASYETSVLPEMTKILNMTEGQYKMRICRLKKKLAKNLEEIGYESPKKKKK